MDVSENVSLVSVCLPNIFLLAAWFNYVCFSIFFQNDTVTVRTRKFMTNRLLQRKQMVSFPTNYFVSAVVIGVSYRNFVVVGRRRPASRQGDGPQDRNQGEACKNVQDHPWRCVRVRLQNSVWWRQDNRLCHGVRLPRLCQEERA